MRKSSFIYGFDIEETNKYFYFEVDSEQFTAELNVGNYTMTTMANELSRAMNEQSAAGFAVTVARQERKYTIESPTSFILLGSSISDKNCNSLLGFSESVSDSAISHESESAAGKVYTPALPLYDYAAFEDSYDAGDATVTESSDGSAEIVTTGEIQEMECAIKWVTDIVSEGHEYFGESDAKSAANEFMRYITGKKKVEFCEDSEDLTAYTPCILSSTKRNKQGVGYRLQRMRTEGYFETGPLVFRKLEL